MEIKVWLKIKNERNAPKKYGTFGYEKSGQNENRRKGAMSMGKLTLAERETIINYNQEGKRANVYTCDPVLIRKLDKIITSGNAAIEVESEDIHNKSYTVPKKWVKIRPPKVLSEKQLEVLKKIHEKR